MAWHYGDKPALLELYRKDPLLWYERRWQGDPRHFKWSGYPCYANKTRWDGDRDPLLKAWNSIAQSRNTGVESATGTGKTYWAAILTLWFLDVYRSGQVVLVGPSEGHLKAHYWAYMQELKHRFLELHPTAKFYDSVLMRVDDGDPFGGRWSVWAKTAQRNAGAMSTTGMQGTHGRDMLHIIEEAAGASQADMDAVINTSTGQNNPILALGNPNSTTDSLHQFCKRPGTVHVVISALDHPNVVCGVEVMGGAVTRRSVQDRRGENGENVGTNFFKSRVRGRSPEQGEKAAFRHEWFEMCLQAGADPRVREEAEKMRYGSLGLDVARSVAGDEAAACWGRGRLLEGASSFQCPNASDLAVNVVNGQAWAKANGKHSYPLPWMREYPLLASMIGVDFTGVGTATVEMFRHLRFEVVPLEGAAKPWDTGRKVYNPVTKQMLPEASYVNLRAQMAWQLSDDMRLARVAFSPSTREFVMRAAKQASAMEEVWSNNKKGITGKDKLKELFAGKSPNELDALMMWNWVRVDRVGRSGSAYS